MEGPLFSFFYEDKAHDELFFSSSWSDKQADQIEGNYFFSFLIFSSSSFSGSPPFFLFFLLFLLSSSELRGREGEGAGVAKRVVFFFSFFFPFFFPFTRILTGIKILGRTKNPLFFLFFSLPLFSSRCQVFWLTSEVALLSPSFFSFLPPSFFFLFETPIVLIDELNTFFFFFFFLFHSFFLILRW